MPFPQPDHAPVTEALALVLELALALELARGLAIGIVAVFPFHQNPKE